MPKPFIIDARLERTMLKNGDKFKDGHSANQNGARFQAIHKYNESHIVFDLHAAIFAENSQDVRNILLSYSHVDFNKSVQGATALSLSLYKRNFEIFQLLMRHHSKTQSLNLNKRSKDHLCRIEPPLITATRMHFVEGAKVLLSNQADIDAVNNSGHTALWTGCRQDMVDFAKFLISSGASVNKTDDFNHTPLLTSLSYKVRNTIPKTLILNGSSLQGPKYRGKYSNEHNPLFWAGKSGNTDMVQLILNAGIPSPHIREVKEALEREGLFFNSVAYCLIASECKNPFSLKHLCRMTIRCEVSVACEGKYFIRKMEQLPLPLVIKQYLLLQC